MNIKLKAILRTTLASIVALTSLLSFSSVSVFAAGTAAFYMTPSTSSHDTGTTFTIALRVNPAGSSINEVDTEFTYPTSMLKLVSMNTTCVSPWTGTATNPVDHGGVVNISCFTSGTPITADSLISSITFQALTGSGSGSLAYSNNSTTAAYSSVDASDVTGSKSGASVTFTTPPTVVTQTGCPSGQTGTPPNCVTPAKTSTTTTTQTKTTNTSTPTPVKAATPVAVAPAIATPIPTPTASTPTTPEGQPVPASQVVKKSNTKLYIIGVGTLGIVVLATVAFMLMRRNSLAAGSSHVISNVSPLSTATTAPINRIPAVETKAPGEIVNPNDPNSPTNNTSL